MRHIELYPAILILLITLAKLAAELVTFQWPEATERTRSAHKKP